MIQIIVAVVGAIVTIIVWYLSSRDLRKQDRENKKREIRLQFLIDAYRKIECAAGRNISYDSEHAHNLESAVSDIQLFGSQKQAEFAQSSADKFASTGKMDNTDLLNELRRDLRAELDLEALQGKRTILRITANETPNK
ncbi:MAG: hypothetical protein Q7J68_05510 [Thermoplasmata archaeon]|nr:hypothetical protein [Thermoplasmata archaeon]